VEEMVFRSSAYARSRDSNMWRRMSKTAFHTNVERVSPCPIPLSARNPREVEQRR
jgi:hypothetical protein